MIWAKTDLQKRELTAFLVEKAAPGLSVGRAEDKMGLRGSTTVQLHLDLDGRVAARVQYFSGEYVLDDRHRGLLR